MRAISTKPVSAAATVALLALVWTSLAVNSAAAQPRQPTAPMSERAAQVYAQTDLLMRKMGDDVGDQMMALLLPVVRDQPHSLLIGRLVVAAARIAHGADGPSRVDALLAQAEAAPNDALAQFIAGVAAHYRGHGHGASRAAKSADYQLTIKHLRRAEATLGHAPRLWIYLAVSYYRTGQQQRAEAAIKRAAQAERGEDADVYYCSAEVYHQHDPARALRDIEHYLAIMARNRAKGAYTAPHKEAAVQRMKRHLEAVVAGREEPMGLALFDPVVTDPWLPRGAGTKLLALLLALGPLALVVAWKRVRTSG